MACINCSTEEDHATTLMPCRCCALLDKDESIKNVKWCSVCQAHICSACAKDPVRRTRAFVKDKTEKVVNIVENLMGKKKRADKDDQTETSA